MLSEEEKKAIERLKQRVDDNEDYKTVQVWLTDDVVAVNTILNLITNLQKENEEKDKQMDLAVEMIHNLSEYHPSDNEFCKEICIKEDIDCIDCIKQYFEKLAKKGE